MLLLFAWRFARKRRTLALGWGGGDDLQRKKSEPRGREIDREESESRGIDKEIKY
jgi:hypothetical protein